jgi:YVTN family beta-propeller protein
MRLPLLILSVTILTPSVVASAQESTLPRRAADTAVITTSQTISPAGATAVFDGRVHGVAFAQEPGQLWVAVSSDSGYAYRVSWQDNRVMKRITTGAPGLAGITVDPTRGGVPLETVVGSVRFQAGSHLPGATVVPKADTEVSTEQLIELGADSAIVRAASLGDDGSFPSPPAVGSCGDRGFVIASKRSVDSVIVLDAISFAVVWRVSVGVAPFAAVVDPRRCQAFITNWGGRTAKPGDAVGVVGGGGEGLGRGGIDGMTQRAVIDSTGAAARGAVTQLDLRTGRTIHTIEVGRHPTAIAFDSARRRIFVADGNEDAVSVIDADEGRVVQTIQVNPFHGHPFGVSPTAVIISRDGETVYLALGGVNAVAVIDAATGTVRGLIPTGWYPSSLALSRDGAHLAVGALLGAGPGRAEPKLDKYTRYFYPDPSVRHPNARFVHSDRGTVSVIDIPDPATLAGYTRAVAANTGLKLADASGTAAPPRAGIRLRPVPERAGEPSLITHVVYVVKENRSYDQLLGDIGKGESDSTLTMYGRHVTPNQHQLAEEFALLDNAYATGGNSGDGHQWLTQADEVDYDMWQAWSARTYPFDGTDPLAYARSGFIWDNARRHGRTVQIFGEYAGDPLDLPGDSLIAKRSIAEWQAGRSFLHRYHIVAPLRSVNRLLAHDYPQFVVHIPDVARADIFLSHLAAWSRAGTMPNLVILQLPWDHTEGTMPNWPTPAAMIADNDWAVGKVVEGLTHSPFWKSMAIVVIEDDAQGGVDHIDGHRMPALVVSPYVRRHSIDHTMYGHPSFLKTIELMLGLPNMTLFDLVATDMRASFTDTADVTPYTAIKPQQRLDDFNPSTTALRGPARDAALASARMDFRVPDAAPADELNRILWHAARGWDVPYPEERRGPFLPTPPSTLVDRDD